MALREFVKKISPAWLQDGVAERFLYNFGLGGDAVLEKLTQAMHAHMPTKASATSLPYIGADRLIAQGLTEAPSSYAVRLQHAFEDWQLAGNDWSVLRQTLGFLLAKTPAARAVTTLYLQTIFGIILERSSWNSYAAGDDTTKAPTHVQHEFGDATAPNWDWDSLSPNDGAWAWWRWWLILFSTGGNQWCGPAPFKFGVPGVKIGKRPDASIGMNVPSSVGSTIRKIVGLWQRSGAWCRWIVVSFNASSFDPAQPTGGGINPDGTWGRWSTIVNGQYVPSRFSTAKYIDGVI